MIVAAGLLLGLVAVGGGPVRPAGHRRHEPGRPPSCNSKSDSNINSTNTNTNTNKTNNNTPDNNYNNNNSDSNSNINSGYSLLVL